MPDRAPPEMAGFAFQGGRDIRDVDLPGGKTKVPNFMTNFRRVAVHLALIALMLRALLPAGWMPNPGGANGAPFVICTMDGPLKALDAKGKPIRHDPRDRDACPFAAAAHLAPPAELASLALPAFAAGAAAAPSQPVPATARAHYDPQSPRAPPANA
jgi:Protein of unknown function (DUF2946)